MASPPPYRHAQALTLLWVLLLASGALMALLAWRVPGAPVGPTLLLAALPLVILALLGRLVIELDDAALAWHFGWLGWPRWRVALGDIAAVEATRAPAAAGVGIRVIPGARLYNATLGGPAVALTLRNGRRILLGTPDAGRLAARIAAQLGTPA